MLLFIGILGTGCQTAATSKPKPCTDGWYALVESELQIADESTRNGIRYRSPEWLHAVDERLGMNTGEKRNSTIGSHSWCKAIDRKLFSSKATAP